MDPYADGKPLGTNPRLMLQLGNVSEDVLKDGKLQYENGLPTPNTTCENLQLIGEVSQTNSQFYMLSTENEERTAQDVGFDGLDDSTEATPILISLIQ
jgi:cell surface protein SprA